MDLKELQAKKEEIVKQIEILKPVFQEITRKKIDDITQEDIEKFKSAYGIWEKVMEYGCFFQNLKNEKSNVERRFGEVDQEMKKYPLIERRDIIGEEEERNLNLKLEIIRSIEEYKDEIDSMIEVVKEAKTVISGYHAKIEKQELDEKKAKIIKLITEPSESKAVWQYYDDKRIGFGKIFSRPVSEKVMKLMREFRAFDLENDVQIIRSSEEENPRDAVETYYRKTVSFRRYEECDLSEKQAIKEYEHKLKEIAEDESGEYDKEGKVFIPIYGTPGTHRSTDIVDTVEISITPRQLAQAGILYTDLDWKTLEQAKEEQNQAEMKKQKALKKELFIKSLYKMDTFEESEIGFVESKEGISRAMSKKLFDLGKEHGIGFPSEDSKFIHMEECSEEQKNKVLKRRRKIERFQKRVLGSEDGKFDKIGVIFVPIYGMNDMGNVVDTITIEVTQRALAKAGILPEDFGWKEKRKVTEKDIAIETKKQGITVTEVSGFKKFMKKLLDRVQGKGEK